MFHESSSTFSAPPCLPGFLALLTAIAYPEREQSDKLGSAVIGRLEDDTADRRRGDGQEERLLHIKLRSADTGRYLPRVGVFSLYTIQRPEMTSGGVFRENSRSVLL